MWSLAVFVVFCAIFLASSLAIPSPLFPGNVVCLLFKISDFGVSLGSALVNGIFYGFLAWIVFSLSFKWIEHSLSTEKSVKEE